jgi:hypothetical protein
MERQNIPLLQNVMGRDKGAIFKISNLSFVVFTQKTDYK